jgi:hypothetical protein
LNNIGIGYLEPKPIVFKDTSPCVLYSNNKIFGTGNDVIIIDAGDYSIGLMQSNTSTTIPIRGKLIKFSITFVLIS